MKEIIEMVLEEVDPDIKEMMLRVEPRNEKDGYKNYELLTDPANFIIGWQYMRDYKGTTKRK